MLPAIIQKEIVFILSHKKILFQVIVIDSGLRCIKEIKLKYCHSKKFLAFQSFEREKIIKNFLFIDYEIFRLFLFAVCVNFSVLNILFKIINPNSQNIQLFKSIKLTV